MNRLHWPLAAVALVLAACVDEERTSTRHDLGVIRSAANTCANVKCPPPTQCSEPGVCNPNTGRCTYANKATGTPCNDNDLCTSADVCAGGSCKGTPITCTASDQCHDAGTCNPLTGACSNPPVANGISCSDGNSCTLNDSCQAGQCVSSGLVTCSPPDQCHVTGVCNPATGSCSNPSKPNGSACTDGDACTQSDQCVGGQCVPGARVVCSAMDQCHDAGTCDPATGVCSNPQSPPGTGCDDGEPCTVDDVCGSGSCAGTRVQYAVTRNLGFFMTHESAVAACLAKGAIQTDVAQVTSTAQALGLLWSSPLRFANGERRSELDGLRLLLARQHFVATCNNRLFAADAPLLLSQATAALSRRDCGQLRLIERKLEDFNNTGVLNAYPAGFSPGASTPTHARSIGVDPTAPTTGSCQ